ncbi:hypothetical protein POTOM_024532 [Populus tomentosa]|uniref:Wax synthase domain-containing protein n=1 Tax=Populus tomentosa TaxID=118781 RepID=A0A8X8CWD6_POPTO|nr:hypothetical protein POTOM_024532 [Populus tomentosa]
MEDETKNLSSPIALLLSSLGYSYVLATYMKKGLTRVLFLLPTFYLLTIFPWWNRLSSNILRQTIYEPTQNVRVGFVGVGKARMLAMITTLVISGIMHKLMFYYISCGTRPTWEVTWFFVLQGISMVFEGALKYLARVKGWTPDPTVSNVLTLAFVSFTFSWFLVLPVWRSGRNECGFRPKILPFRE